MRKIFCLLAIVFLVSMLFVPLVSADVVVINSHSPVTTNNAVLHHVHPSASTLFSARGIPFEAQNGGYVSTVTVKLRIVGSPIGHLSLNITGVDGSYLPNATVFSSSTSVYEVAELTTSYASYTFQFPATDELLEGEIYSMVFYISEQTFMDYNNRVEIQGDAGSSYPYHVNYYSSSAWHDGTAHGIYFVMYGDTVSGATPTPAPSATPSGDGDATLEYWGDIVATWIFPILLVLVPAVIAAYYLGKIGFIIGLNIGMILGYAALPSIFGLWTVVMLVLVDIGYFFFARG